jgi:hypothetical protein
MMAGRPRKTALAAQAAPEAQSTAPDTTGATPKSRRRRRSSVGGLQLKLSAPQRPGYVRRWVLDDPSRIISMQDLGYDFAEAEAKTEGLGTRIERHAGKDAEGKPQRLILMETPQEEYDLGLKDKEAALKPFEDALRAGRDTTGTVQDQYAPSERSSVSSSHSSA